MTGNTPLPLPVYDVAGVMNSSSLMMIGICLSLRVNRDINMYAQPSLTSVHHVAEDSLLMHP